MKEKMLEDLKFYYPDVVEDAIDYYEKGKYELIVKTKDGNAYSWDNMERTIRRLPRPNEPMTEEQCKREFGIRLRRIMYVKGITQNELSELTGISQPILSGYITGKTAPSFVKVDVIAKALDCSADDFRLF